MCRCLLSNVSEANMRSRRDSWIYVYPSHQLAPLPPHREKKKKTKKKKGYSAVQYSTVTVIIKLESKLVGIKAPCFTISAPPYLGSGQVFTQGMCQPTRLLCSKLRLLYSKSRRRYLHVCIWIEVTFAVTSYLRLFALLYKVGPVRKQTAWTSFLRGRSI